MGISLRFGEWAVQAGYVTAEQVEAVLAEQQRRARRFELPLIGEMLVEQGLLTPQQVLELMHRQGVKLYRHPHTQRQYNVVRARRDELYTCPVDGMRLIPVSPAELERLEIVGTIHPNGEVEMMQPVETQAPATGSPTTAEPTEPTKPEVASPPADANPASWIPPTPAVQLHPATAPFQGGAAHSEQPQPQQPQPQQPQPQQPKRRSRPQQPQSAVSAEPAPERQVAPPGALDTKRQELNPSGSGSTERIPRRPAPPKSRDTSRITAAVSGGSASTRERAGTGEPGTDARDPQGANPGVGNALAGNGGGHSHRSTPARQRDHNDGTVTYLPRSYRQTEAASTARSSSPTRGARDTSAPTAEHPPLPTRAAALPHPVHPEQLHAWQLLVRQDAESDATLAVGERLGDDTPEASVHEPHHGVTPSSSDLLAAVPVVPPFQPSAETPPTGEPGESDELSMLESDPVLLPFSPPEDEPVRFDEDSVQAAAEAAFAAAAAEESDSTSSGEMPEEALETAISFPPAEAMRDKPNSPAEEEMLDTSLSQPPAAPMRGAPETLEEAEEVARDTGVVGPFPAAGAGDFGGVPEALPAESSEVEEPLAHAEEQKPARDNVATGIAGESVSEGSATGKPATKSTATGHVGAPNKGGNQFVEPTGDVTIPFNPRSRRRQPTPPSKGSPNDPDQAGQMPAPAPLPTDAGGFAAFAGDETERRTGDGDLEADAPPLPGEGPLSSTDPHVPSDEGSESGTLFEIKAAAAPPPGLDSEQGEGPPQDPSLSPPHAAPQAHPRLTELVDDEMDAGDPWESDEAMMPPPSSDYIELDDYPHGDAPLALASGRVDSPESGDDWDGAFLALSEQQDVMASHRASGARAAEEELVLEPAAPDADGEREEEDSTADEFASPTAAATDFTLRDAPPPPPPPSPPIAADVDFTLPGSRDEAPRPVAEPQLEEPHRDRVRRFTADRLPGPLPKEENEALKGAVEALRSQTEKGDEIPLLLVLALLARLGDT